MLRCSGDLELGPEWLRFLWLSAAAEQLGVEFDRSGLHGWLAIRRLRRREAEMYERREAEAERKAVAERERRDAEDRERRKEAERAEQWRRAEEKRRITRQQDEMREREACKREDEEAARAEEERVWKEEQAIHDEAQRMEEEARRLRQQQHARNVAGAMEQLIKQIIAEPNKEQELIAFTRRRYDQDPEITTPEGTRKVNQGDFPVNCILSQLPNLGVQRMR